MAEKIVKNTPYFHTNENGKISLVQDLVTFVENNSKVVDFTETKVIVEDIWEDLKNTSGSWKWNNKKYFYWEVYVTNLEGEDIKIKIEAPTPDRALFVDEAGDVPEISDSDSSWTKYWIKNITKTENNYEIKAKVTEDRIDPLKSTLVDYTPGKESFSEINDSDIPKSDDRDLISNLQSFLF